MQEHLAIWTNNNEYVQLLQLMARLSNLFSDSVIPFIHYRITENIFCKCCSAINLSRTDTAYDAQYGHLGVGIKTFQLKTGGQSIEKIAEFNKLSSELRSLNTIDLALRVSQLRNERIEFANNLYSIKQGLYHIVGRNEGNLILFNTSYDLINIDNIHNVKKNKETSISFDDGQNEYVFNYSKSVLLKRFQVPHDSFSIPVEIITDPYELLKELLLIAPNIESVHNNRGQYVVLPLYSDRNGGYVPERSGLNQWNARGRKRDENEVYIPIPQDVHKLYPDFFPPREVPFNLTLPNNTVLSVKLCQENNKALMSNPNSALGRWLLRDVMQITPGELVTMSKLNELGFNSVIITKDVDGNFKISVSNTETYSSFISD